MSAWKFNAEDAMPPLNLYVYWGVGSKAATVTRNGLETLTMQISRRAAQILNYTNRREIVVSMICLLYLSICAGL